jgi:hypothetical protein
MVRIHIIMKLEQTFILQRYGITKVKNIKCKAYTPISAARKLADYIILKTDNNLDFSIQNKDTKKHYEYTLRRFASDFTLRPKKTSSGGGITSLQLHDGMEVVLKVPEGYLTFDSNADVKVHNDGNKIELKITSKTDQKSIFTISLSMRANSRQSFASFINKYQKENKNSMKYFNIGHNNHTSQYVLKDDATKFRIHEKRDKTYFLNLSSRELANIHDVDIIPYHGYILEKLRSREIGVKEVSRVSRSKSSSRKQSDKSQS